MGFLDGKRARRWEVPDGGRGAFTADGSFVGAGRAPLEVAVARSANAPNESDVRNLWKRRKGLTPSPLLLVVLWPGPHGERASACGPSGDEPPVYSDRDGEQIERVARLALEESDHHAARRLLDAYLPQKGGVRNQSLFASHHLFERVPRRPGWRALCEDSMTLLTLRREALLTALGYTLEPSGTAVLLRVEGQARALALFLDDAESPEAAGSRFNGMTPVSWAVARATADNIPFVIVTRGDQVRIHATTRESARRTTAFAELNLPLLTAEDAGYLKLLFSADTVREGGELERLLAESTDFALGLGVRLRDRVYDESVPAIANALIARHEADGGATDAESLASLYSQTLLVLFRLLFVAYAEDRGLLPLDTNDLYRQQSLKALSRKLVVLSSDCEDGVAVSFDEYATDYWDQVRALWSAIDRGRREWGVPAYNGGLFSSDLTVNADGVALGEISLTNAEFGPCLLALLADRGEEGLGVVDFAALDVREFGTIYEGLLESNLSVAPCDLTIDSDGVYTPARSRDDVVYFSGEVYLHDSSGARKASGAYFTKPFAVQHLLDHALEPALDDHLSRLSTLVAESNDLAAADAFFDFRCVDLAMGSGHFLVAAVDVIERRLSEFLASHRLGGVLDELDRLGAKAAANLADVGLLADAPDTASLLRRQIARRCIYGVDLNPTPVELARLALWIHTFVPGLPLTTLGHGLVVGDSLTGIGTLDEVLGVLDPDAAGIAVSFLRASLESALSTAGEALARFGEIGEADRGEITLARAAQEEAQAATESARLLCDLALAVRLGEVALPETFDEDRLLAAALDSNVPRLVEGLHALHFPVAFPEVFSRDRAGFDCIVGNPPWEEATVEELGFFALRFPGLKSMGQADQKKELTRIRKARSDLVAEYDASVAAAAQLRKVLLAGPYPGMGTGDPDLYKAFGWRFWQLLRIDGAVGVVLPRSALSAKGSATWRETVLAEGTFADVTMMTNRAGWVFDDAEHRYTIGLVTLRKGPSHLGQIALCGPYRSFEDYEHRGPPAVIATTEFLSWSESASFPLLPSQESIEVFKQLRTQPRLDGPGEPRVRPATELHATNDKPHMILTDDPDDGFWPVYGGRSFDLWEPDTGDYYAWSEPTVVVPLLLDRRDRSAGRAGSAYREFPVTWRDDAATLPCLHPRIAFRDITRSTDTRTMRAALVPPEVVLTNKAPYFLVPSLSPQDEAFTLGVLCSVPFDWAARRVVEVSMNFHILNSLPFPRTDHLDPIRRRVVEIAGTLAAVDDRYRDWAAAVDVPIGGVSSDEREPWLAELDGAVSFLYGLDDDQVRVVYSTFHEGWDYEPRLVGVLEHRDRLREFAP